MRLFTILGLFAAGPAFACDDIIHSCTFNGGVKTVMVCLKADTVTYDYGPTGGTPELSLEVAIRDVDYVPWSGSGRSISEAIVFHNQGYHYEVYSGANKPDETGEIGPLFGGLVVSQGSHGDAKDTLLARLTCDVGSVKWGGFGTGGIYGAKTAAGQCYDPREQVWGACEN